MHYVGKVNRKISNFTFRGLLQNSLNAADTMTKSLPNGKYVGAALAGASGLGAGYAIDEIQSNLRDANTRDLANQKLSAELDYIPSNPGYLMGQQINATEHKGEKLADLDARHSTASIEAYSKNSLPILPLAGAAIGAGIYFRRKR